MPTYDDTRVLWWFAQEAGLPNTGLTIGDVALVGATGEYWQAASATAWTKITGSAPPHNHSGVYEPVHSHPYSASGHAHAGVYEPVHSHPYAAAGHTHGGGSSPWTLAIKTADQNNNTTTLADDTAVQFTPVANTQYAIRLQAFWLTNATADLKYRLVHTGTTTRVRRRVKRTATTDIAQTIELKTAFDAADVILSTTGLNPWLEEDIILQVGATPGVVKLQWAQVTANAGPTTCLEGSYLEYAVS